MMPIRVKLVLFLKTMARGFFGITAEIFLVYFFIFVGFIVCFVWWSILK